MPASPGTSGNTSAKTRSLQAASGTSDNLLDTYKWDSTLGVALLEWLLALKDQDWLFTQIPGAHQLFTEGTINVRGRTMYENANHKEQATHDKTTYTFDAPAPAFAFARSHLLGKDGFTSPTSEELKTKAAAAKTARTPKPSGKSPEKADASTPDSQDTAPTADTFAPGEIERLDREVCVFIQGLITPRPFAKRLAEKAKMSGRQLIIDIVKKAEANKERASQAVESKIAAHIAGGIKATTIYEWNSFYEGLEELNEIAHVPRSEGQVRDVYLTAIMELGVPLRDKLDTLITQAEIKAKVDVLPMDGLREVITNCIAQREEIDDRIANSAARALAVRQADDERAARALAARPDAIKDETGSSAHKQPKAKRPRTDKRPERPPWTVEDGACKWCNNGDATGPNKGHWNSTCAKNPKNIASADGHSKLALAADCSDDDDSSDPDSDSEDEDDEQMARALFAAGKETTISLSKAAALGASELLAELHPQPAKKATKTKKAEVDGHAKMAVPDDETAEPPMGLAVPGRRPRHMLNAKSPLKDIAAYVVTSPDPRVRRISTGTGGVHSRSRKDILADIDAVEARYSPDDSPDYSSSDSDGDGGVPEAAIDDDGPPPPPAAAAQAAVEDAAPRPAASPVQVGHAIPPPVPHIATDEQWEGIVSLREAATRMYRLAQFENDNGSSVITPPNYRKDKRDKKYAFYTRGHEGVAEHEFGTETPDGRRSLGKTAHFFRIYLIGDGEFAVARAAHGFKGSDKLLKAIYDTQLAAAFVMRVLPPGDQDAAIWALAPVFRDALEHAQAAALAEPMTTKFGVMLSAATARRVDTVAATVKVVYNSAIVLMLAAIAALIWRAQTTGDTKAALALDAGTLALPPAASVGPLECAPTLIGCLPLLLFPVAKQANDKYRVLARVAREGPLRAVATATHLAFSVIGFILAAVVAAALRTVSVALAEVEMVLNGALHGRPEYVERRIVPAARILLRFAVLATIAAHVVLHIATEACLPARAGVEPHALLTALLTPCRRGGGRRKLKATGPQRRTAWRLGRRKQHVRERTYLIRSSATSRARTRTEHKKAEHQLAALHRQLVLQRIVVIQRAWRYYRSTPPKQAAAPRRRRRHVRRSRNERTFDTDCLIAKDGRCCRATGETIHMPKCTIGKFKDGRASKATPQSTVIKLALDSGCTWHCHPHRKDLINFRAHKQRMVGCDGASCQVLGIGDLPIIAKDLDGNLRRITLTNVRCVPDFTDTLISVECLYTDLKAEARFANHRKIRFSTKSPIASLRGSSFPFQREDGLFMWKVISEARSKAGPARAMSAKASSLGPADLAHSTKARSYLRAMPADDLVGLLHRRLHVGQDTIKKLHGRTTDIPKSVKGGNAHSCDHCITANATKLSHHAKPKHQPSHVGRLIHADIVGPFAPTRIGGFRYILVLVDDHSRYVSAYPIAKKSQAIGAIRKYVSSINRMVNEGRKDPVQVVGHLHSDNAGEFLSHEFTEFLDHNGIDHTTCPPHVHSLNGVAERSIRTLVENMRANLQASNMPLGFWNYAVNHSLDVINRTSGPSGSSKTSYELMTGHKPDILSIWPLGCRAYAVKPRHEYKKTYIEPHAWKGINLGKIPSIPGGYHIWLPDEQKVVPTSEVYFDETYMPWKPKGERREGAHLPHVPFLGESAFGPEVPAHGTDLSAEGNTDVVESTSVRQAFDRATRGPSATSSVSNKVLILFSGPKQRPDGLASFLNSYGLETVMFDNDPGAGGDEGDNLLNDKIYEALMGRVKQAEFCAIFAAPPCSTFSICRFIKPKLDEDGPRPLRLRTCPAGKPSLRGSRKRELDDANKLATRTVALIAAGVTVGCEYIIENPADRGNLSDADLYIDDRHAPLWLYPPMVALRQATAARSVTFPMCAFNAEWQKFTTLMFSAGFDSFLRPLERLRCPHKSHPKSAGGTKGEDGKWISSEAAAYPADFNLYISCAIRNLAQPGIKPEPPDAVVGRGSKEPTSNSEGEADAVIDEVQTFQSVAQIPQTTAAPTPERKNLAAAMDSARVTAESVARLAADNITKQLASKAAADSAARNIMQGAQTLASAAEPKAAKPRRVHFQRDQAPEHAHLRVQGSPIRTRGRGLLCTSPARIIRQADGRVLLAVDPASRKHAMELDSEGWIAAEIDELENHRSNGSWTVIDRSELPRGRKLVKTVWVYKVKRSGKLKARLCVQGCSQIPGVDYNQTHCSTMRSGTLRTLSACAAQLGLGMRRWDFVAAYLQGELQEGEVVYCYAPPGHPSKGADGQDRILRIEKPVYGMAQAGRRWQRSLYPWLQEWGLKPCHSDASVFQCSRTMSTPDGPREERIIIGCYVDDLCTLYSHDDEHSLYRQFVHDLNERWKVEDEGEISDLLGIEIAREGNIVSLSQASYIDRLCEKYISDSDVSSHSCNVPATEHLAQIVADALGDPTERPADQIKAFQGIVGALLYAATNTRPDIAYAVGMLCRAMTRPTTALEEEARRVVHYLKRTRELGLRYQATRAQAKGMSDSDWAVRRSTTGWVFMLSNAAISWSSRKQDSIALSSCEAEIMALSEAAKEGIYLKGFLEELGVREPGVPFDVATDNTGARDLSYNPEHHQKVKHIERRHFFVREAVENLQVNVPYVNTAHNLADFFTKALPPKVFEPLRNTIMNAPSDCARVSVAPPKVGSVHEGALVSESASAPGSLRLRGGGR